MWFLLIFILGLAVAAYGYIAWAMWSAPDEGPAPAGIVTIFMVVRLVQGWATIVALVGIADRFANRDHPRRAMLAEAVFPFYIIHQTIIVVAMWLLLMLPMPEWAQFAITLVATVAGCWAFYLIGREVPWLRPLIGLKLTRTAKPVKASATA